MRLSLFGTLAAFVAVATAMPHLTRVHTEVVKRQEAEPPVEAPAMTDAQGNIVPFDPATLPNQRKVKARKA